MLVFTRLEGKDGGMKGGSQAESGCLSPEPSSPTRDPAFLCSGFLGYKVAGRIPRIVREVKLDAPGEWGERQGFQKFRQTLRS